MCRISMETVRRANQRTINQFRKRGGDFRGTVSPGTFHVSVTVGGKLIEKNITAAQVKASFGKAMQKYYGKEV